MAKKKKKDKSVYYLIGFVILVVLIKLKQKSSAVVTPVSPVVINKKPKNSENKPGAQPVLSTRTSLYEFALKCSMKEKKIERSAEEYAMEVEKMKRIHRRMEDAEKFKYVSEEICDSAKFCPANEIDNVLSFTKQDFRAELPDGKTVAGNYQIEKKLIHLALGDSNKEDIVIMSWDKQFFINKFLFRGKSYDISFCKSEEELKDVKLKRQASEQHYKEEEEKKLVDAKKKVEEAEEAAKLAKEKAEKDQEEAEKLAKEKAEKAERLAQPQKLDIEKDPAQIEEENRLKKEKELKEKAKKDKIEKM